MASPLNNPWVSGGLGVGVVLYLGVSMTPEAWKQPVRNFFTGEVRREGSKEPELKIGTEKVFRAVTGSGGSGDLGGGFTQDLFSSVGFGG